MITNIRKSTNYRSRKKHILVGVGEDEISQEEDIEPVTLNFDVLPHNPYALDYLAISDLEENA
jgi:hypothetical protein